MDFMKWFLVVEVSCLLVTFFMKMLTIDEDYQILDYCEETLEYTYVDDSDHDERNVSVFDQMMQDLDFDPASE